MTKDLGREPDRGEEQRHHGVEEGARHGGRSLVLSTFAYWTATGATLLGGILRGKVAAVVLGVSGVGITAQLSTITALLSAVAALGIGAGGIKLLADARARQDQTALGQTMSLIMWAPCFVGSLAFVLAALLSRPLSQALLGDSDYAKLLVVSMASVPLNCLLASFQVIMQGHEMARRLSANSVVAAFLTTALAIPLTIAFGVTGAVWAIPVSAGASVGLFMHRERWILREALPLRLPSRRARRELQRLGGASVVASAVTLTADTLLRSVTIHRLGLSDNGLYQPAHTFTAILLAQLAGALSLVLLPRLSYELGRGMNGDVQQTLRRAVEAAVVLAVPVCLMAAALANAFILVLFDRSFLPAADVLAVQAAAELPRFAAYVLGAVLLPAGLVRPWLFGSLISNAARVALALLLLDALGLYALALGVGVMWTITLAWTVFVVRRHFGWRAGRRLRNLTAASAVIVGSGVAMSFGGTAWDVLIAGVAVMWIAVAGRSEVSLVLGLVRHRGATGTAG